jgi:hypothetical protein
MGVQIPLWQSNQFDCPSVDVNSRANLSKSKREDGKDRIQLIRLTGRMGAGGGKRLIRYVAISQELQHI